MLQSVDGGEGEVIAGVRRRKPAKKSPVRRPKRPRKEVKPLPFDRRKRPQKRAPRPDLRRAKERAALQRWLNQHPTVAASLRWESPTGLRDYNAWTAAEQSDLFTYYWHIRERNQLGLGDPPPNALSPADNAFPATALRIEHAWPLYVAHAANSLYVEVRNRVPWRVADAAPEILTRLFDSRAMFRRTDAGLYQLGDVNQLFGRGGWILPAPPDVVRAFLEGNALQR